MFSKPAEMDTSEHRGGMEQAVPGVCSPAAAAERSPVLGKTAWPRYPAQKSIAKKQCWRLRSPHVEMPSLASGQAPDCPEEETMLLTDRVCKHVFYLVTLNHSGQTRCLPAQQPKPSPYGGPPPLLQSALGPSPFAGTVWVPPCSRSLSFLSTSNCGCACTAPCPCLSQPPWGSGQALVFLLPFPSLPSACVRGREEAALSFMKRREDKIGPLSL